MADTASRAGSTYGNPDILSHCAEVHASHDAALDRAFRAAELDGLPPIQVGPSEGRLLGVLAAAVGARRVVEVGTLAGYSALWLARALAPGGHLWTIEADARHAAVAERNLREGGLADRVTVCVGPAEEVLPTLVAHGPFDLVFIDADKAGYAFYGEWACENLRAGGLVVGDNAYLFGRLLDDSPEARAMRRFHEIVSARCVSVCTPTPDGLVIGVRK